MKLPPRSERESTECGLMDEGRWIQIQSTEEEEENDFVAALHIHANWRTFQWLLLLQHYYVQHIM